MLCEVNYFRVYYERLFYFWCIFLVEVFSQFHAVGIAVFFCCGDVDECCASYMWLIDCFQSSFSSFCEFISLCFLDSVFVSEVIFVVKVLYIGVNSVKTLSHNHCEVIKI